MANIPGSKTLLSMPDDIRSQLDEKLSKREFQSTREATWWLNRRGVPASQGQVQKYAARLREDMDRVFHEVRVVRELYAQSELAGEDFAKDLTNLNSILANEILLQAMLELRDSGRDPEDVIRAIASASTSIGALGRTYVAQSKWEEEQRRVLSERAELAATEAARLARHAGLGVEQVDKLRAIVLGLAV